MMQETSSSVGWSFFQHIDAVKGDIASQRSGYFRKHRWFNDTERLIAPGERRERERLENVYLDRNTRVRSEARLHACGKGAQQWFTAHEGWAAAIRQDSEFEGRSIPELRHRYHVHQDAVA